MSAAERQQMQGILQAEGEGRGYTVVNNKAEGGGLADHTDWSYAGTSSPWLTIVLPTHYEGKSQVEMEATAKQMIDGLDAARQQLAGMA